RRRRRARRRVHTDAHGPRADCRGCKRGRAGADDAGTCIILAVQTLECQRVTTSMAMTAEPQDRSKRLLTALIPEYISSGEPVASSVLVTAAGLGISSATVRSILARLEDEGFVQQPHTSAGRIPTDRGYRFYVDLLLDSKRSSRMASAVEARLRRDN